jgi:DNA-binding MarR family transcriptional regulator
MDTVECHCTTARRAAQALTAAYDRALGDLGLKVTQFSLMRAVQRNPEANLTALAQATGLDRSTLGRNLRVMEAAGWLDMGRGADLRGRAVRLSSDGEKLLKRALPRWQRVQDEVAGSLGADATRLHRIATAVVQRFGSGQADEA